MSPVAERSGAELPSRFEKAELTAAWRATFVFLSLGAFGAIVNPLLWERVAPGLVSLWPWALLGVVSCVGIALLVALRRRPTIALANLLFLVNIGVGCLAGWITTAELVRSGRRFEPFTTFKLVALVVALAAPTLRKWVGIACAGLVGVLAVVEYFTFTASARAGLPPFEPLNTVAVAGACTILCFYRLQALDLARRMAHARAQTAALEQFARLLVSARHLINTPIQTIECSIAVLRATRNVDDELVLRIERALDRLGRVSHLLTQFEKHMSWQQGEAAVDAEELLGDGFETRGTRSR